MNLNYRQFLRTFTAAMAFFFLIGSYYVIKPTRKPIFLERMGVEHLELFYFISPLIALMVLFFYNYLVTHYPRTQLLRIFFFTIATTFVLFWAAFSVLGVMEKKLYDNLAAISWWRLFAIAVSYNLAAQLYFLFAAVYIIFVTAVFWSFNHDIHTPEESKLFYPYINLGAQVCIIISSQIVGILVNKIGANYLLLIGALGLAMAWAFIELLKNFDPHLEQNRYAKPQATGTLEDIKIFFSNRYVLCIGLLVGLATFTATLCDLQITAMVQRAIPDRNEQTAFWGNMYGYMGMVNIVMCVLITPVLLKFLGPSVAICLYPLLLATIGYFFLYQASLDIVTYFAIAALSFNYTLYNIGKEVFYVPTDKEIKYKLKALCDTVVFRAGDAASSLVIKLYRLLFSWTGGISIVIFVVVAVWIPIILITGRKYKKLVDRQLQS